MSSKTSRKIPGYAPDQMYKSPTSSLVMEHFLGEFVIIKNAGQLNNGKDGEEDSTTVCKILLEWFPTQKPLSRFLFVFHDCTLRAAMMNEILACKIIRDVVIRGRLEDDASYLEGLFHVVGGKNLDGLRIDNIRLDQDAMRALSVLIKTDTIRTLGFTFSELTHKHVAQMAPAMKHSHIQQLDLAYNKLGSRGAKIVADMMEDRRDTNGPHGLCNVLWADLSNNGVGHKGAEAFSQFFLRAGCKGSVKIDGNPQIKSQRHRLELGIKY